MEPEYIECELLDKAMTAAAVNDKDKNRRTWAKAICVLHDIPAADVAPVVHGKWITHYRSGTIVAEGYVSTCCDMWNNRKSDYCPNCGVRMDGDSDALD